MTSLSLNTNSRGRIERSRRVMCVGDLKQVSQYIDAISNLCNVEGEARRAPPVKAKMLLAESLDCLLDRITPK